MRTACLLSLGLLLPACSGDEENAAASGVEVRISPREVQVTTGGTQTFTATVVGASDPSVRWSVREAGGGTIDAGGNYTAPGTTGTYHVVATSVAEPSARGSATVVVDVPSPVDLSILPADRRTRWEPGIPGGVPEVTTVFRTVDARFADGSTPAAAAINEALQAAGDAARDSGMTQVVLLPEGTYRLEEMVILDRSEVVLRGAGPGRTVLRAPRGDRGIWLGQFFPPYPDPIDVVGDVPKGAREITVADASSIEPGDVLQIDQLEDGDPLGSRGFVWRYDMEWAMRGPREADVNGPSSPEGYRPIGQQIEVESKDGNRLRLKNVIHIAFPEAQMPQVFHTATAREGMPGTRRVGLEDLTIRGGTDANVVILNCAHCWVRNVESDGHDGGSLVHIIMDHVYRSVVRDSYVHHATNYAQGGNAYGLAIGTQSTDNLVENGIFIFLNKPVVSQASGGGNVFAYNYVDEAVNGSLTGPWQESALDGSHGAFCFYDLYEGNLAPNVGTDSTHGNNGWITFFRNRAFGQNTSGHTTGNVRAVGIDGWNLEHTSIGNVLLVPGLRINGADSVLFSTPDMPELEGAAVYRLGANAWDKDTGEIAYDVWDDGQAQRLFLRHLDFDHVTGTVYDDPGNPVKELPRSLYLTAKPAFFGDHEWPWVDPLGATDAERVKVLPAKERYDRLR